MEDIKIYALFHNLYGRLFSFEANTALEANYKAARWADKNAMKIGGFFEIKQVSDNFDLHNEYINGDATIDDEKIRQLRKERLQDLKRRRNNE